MTWPDVREFVQHWQAAFHDDSADDEQRAQLTSCEHGLLETLYASRHLRLLATSPLLCALICALNIALHTRVRSLVGDRAGLSVLAEPRASTALKLVCWRS
jgi:hypothetical protein